MRTINLRGTGAGTANSSATGSLIISAGAGPTLIRNNDAQLGAFLSDSNAINTTTLDNCVPLDPGGVMVVDGRQDVYAIGNFATGTIQLLIVDGGISFFQRLSKLTLSSANGVDTITLSAGNPPTIVLSDGSDTITLSAGSPPTVTVQSGSGTNFVKLIAQNPTLIQVGTGDPQESTPSELLATTLGSGATRQVGAELVAARTVAETLGAFATFALYSASVDNTVPPMLQMVATDGTNTTNLTASPTLLQLSGSRFDSAFNTFTGSVPNILADPHENDVVAATQTRITSSYTTPANEPVGTMYRLTAWGTGTQGSTAETLTFGMQAFNVVRNTTAFPATFAAASASFQFYIEGIAEIIATGAGTATIQLSYKVHVRPTGSTADLALTESFQGTTGTTNVAEALFFSCAWGATTGAPILKCVGSILERIAQI